MFFKRNKVQVVQPSDYTDYSERFEELEKMRVEEGYATRKQIIIGSAIPVAASVGLIINNQIKTNEMIEQLTAAVATNSTINTIVDEPINVLAQPPINYDYMIPVNDGGLAEKGADAVAEFSWDLFMAISEPIVQLFVYLSMPVASIIVAASFFILMFGMKEKALNLSMFAGLGYILMQCLPIVFKILNLIRDAMSQVQIQ